MASQPKQLKLARWFDLSPWGTIESLVAFDLGFDGRLYIAFALQPLDYRHEASNGVSYSKPIPSQRQDYRVLAIEDDRGQGKVVRDLTFSQVSLNIHSIQPLPDDQWLLTCGRTRWEGQNTERNGLIYNSQDRCVGKLLLGDGIESVQTTKRGTIWTSYFDEGIFGNFGWQDPIGKSGLCAWDRQGNRVYEFQPRLGLDSICDCYALNVENDNSVWFYYYTRFPLVHWRNGQVSESWSLSIKGSSAFAISRGFAMFRGGYGNEDEFHLFQLSLGKGSSRARRFTVHDDRGRRLKNFQVTARARTLCILASHELYRLPISLASEVSAD